MVELIISDQGWIMERFAREIANRTEDCSISTAPSNEAELVYFLPYSAYTPTTSISCALFTHIEQITEARDRFFNIAQKVDYCVTMAPRYEKELRDHGVSNVRTILPGVNLDSYNPKLRIGVVGRTYHTGRKGEKLIEQVLDLPGIEWNFTGTGWPSPSRALSDEEMPQFYSEMDYILIPSSVEGGPMCVLEALASGTEVISPDIGFVELFPHISYEKNNAASLRAVLQSLAAKKLSLRESVRDSTWANFAKEHRDLFSILLDRSIKAKDVPTSILQDFGELQKSLVTDVRLVLNGSEAVTKGGPSVRVKQLQKDLVKTNIRAAVSGSPSLDFNNVATVTHLFNVWHPKEALTTIDRLFRTNTKILLSPIYLSLGELKWKGERFYQMYNNIPLKELESKFGVINDEMSHEDYKQFEYFPGQLNMLSKIFSMVDAVIYLSEFEKRSLEVLGNKCKEYYVANNPIPHFTGRDEGLFSNIQSNDRPNSFTEKFGLTDYVLCVGRVEMRKNQLMLAHALSSVNIPLVLIGSQSQKRYSEKILSLFGDNVHMIEHIQSGSQLLADAYAGARAFALPSWAEGAPLSALEAASFGVPMVLSDRSSEEEYFGASATYISPDSISDIRNAVLSAYETPIAASKRAQTAAIFSEKFSQARHTSEMVAIYEKYLCNAH